MAARLSQPRARIDCAEAGALLVIVACPVALWTHSLMLALGVACAGALLIAVQCRREARNALPAKDNVVDLASARRSRPSHVGFRYSEIRSAGSPDSSDGPDIGVLLRMDTKPRSGADAAADRVGEGWTSDRVHK